MLPLARLRPGTAASKLNKVLCTTEDHAVPELSTGWVDARVRSRFFSLFGGLGCGSEEFPKILKLVIYGV